MMEDFEPEIIETRILQEGTVVSFERLGVGILLGKAVPLRKGDSFYAVVSIKDDALWCVPPSSPYNVHLHLSTEELLTHNLELVREWFSKLVKGELSRRELYAWCSEIIEAKRKEQAAEAKRQKSAGMSSMKEALNNLMKKKIEYNNKVYNTKKLDDDLGMWTNNAYNILNE